MISVSPKVPGIECGPFLISCSHRVKIGDLKSKIASLLGLENHMQELKFSGPGIVLEDNMKIRDAFKNLSSWHPSIRSFSIMVEIPSSLAPNLSNIPNYINQKPDESSASIYETLCSSFTPHLFYHFTYGKVSWNHPEIVANHHMNSINNHVIDKYIVSAGDSKVNPPRSVLYYAASFINTIFALLLLTANLLKSNVYFFASVYLICLIFLHTVPTSHPIFFLSFSILFLMNLYGIARGLFVYYQSRNQARRAANPPDPNQADHPNERALPQVTLMAFCNHIFDLIIGFLISLIPTPND